MSLKDVFHSSHSCVPFSPRQLCYVTQGCVPFKPILLQDNFVMSLKDVFHSSQSFSMTTLLCHSRCVPFKPILLQDNFVMSLKYVFHSSQSFSKTTLLTLLCHSFQYVFHSSQSFSKTTLLCHSNMCSILTISSIHSPRQLCYVTQICVPFKPILLQDNFVMSLKYVFHSSQSFSKTTLLCHSNMCSIQANPSPRQLCYVTHRCVPF